MALWPGMRSFTLPRSSERYSGVGWKEHELGQQPERLRTPDFAAVFRAELGEHVCSAPGKEDRAGAGRPPGPGRENPALALRRAAECGAYARPASRGLVSICPFCLRVKFAGENPVIRAQPLGGEHHPPPSPILTDGKNDSIGCVYAGRPLPLHNASARIEALGCRLASVYIRLEPKS
ncbi:unnamed protein product [Rangifer tarandus platyrhynchus]|uniref:Uncharacterized protein n=1 Tax=Rangifer tarandus platyrhynchus TaxID=3082113 RepID=A0ABN9A625_RANTA|nr:unnamed protein product [Rangifer tarandus platyrhynchus]